METKEILHIFKEILVVFILPIVIVAWIICSVSNMVVAYFHKDKLECGV